MDVDWLKTSVGQEFYFAAKAKGISVPKVLKDRGFSSARIRIKDYDLTTLLPDIVTVVGDCLAADLTPVVAFQGQNFKDSPNDVTRAEMIAWWKAVATALRDFPERVLLNLLIETTDNVRNNPGALNLFYSECRSEIYAISPDRVLIVPPAGISSPSQLVNLQVPPGCFAEAHFYAAGFTPDPTALKPWTTGTDKEKAPIRKNIEDMKVWQALKGIPVWVGAIMLGNFDDNGNLPSTSHYSIADQVAIATFVCGELRKAMIPFAVNADQHYMDRETSQWIEELQPVLTAITGVEQ